MTELQAWFLVVGSLGLFVTAVVTLVRNKEK